MTSVLLMVAMLLQQPSPARWIIMDHGTEGSSAVDTESVLVEGNRRTFWIRQTHARPRGRVVQTTLRNELDCRGHTITLLAYLDTDRNGNLHASGWIDPDRRQARPIVPGTMAEDIRAALCP